MQVAELTKEWASKWKDIQQIIEVTYVRYCEVTLHVHYVHYTPPRHTTWLCTVRGLRWWCSLSSLTWWALTLTSSALALSSTTSRFPVLLPSQTCSLLHVWSVCVQGDGTTVGSLHASPPADIGMPPTLCAPATGSAHSLPCSGVRAGYSRAPLPAGGAARQHGPAAAGRGMLHQPLQNHLPQPPQTRCPLHPVLAQPSPSLMTTPSHRRPAAAGRLRSVPVQPPSGGQAAAQEAQRE